MVILILRMLMMAAAFIVILFIAYKFIRRLELTDERRVQIEEDIIKIDNAMEMARKAGDAFKLKDLDKARSKLKKILKGGKQSETIYNN